VAFAFLGNLTEPPTPDAIVGMLRPLADQPAPTADLPSLLHWLRDRLNDDHLNDLPRGRSVAPLPERRQALVLPDELTRDHVPGLCHCGASPWNIPSGDRLYLIDPRGISGELAYDAAIIALKATNELPCTRYTEALGRALHIDPSRIRTWTKVTQAGRV
jgi:streptomycin 6-kinase